MLPVDTPNIRGTTPLMTACIEGQRAIVRLLVTKLRADMYIAERLSGFTPLMYAAARGHGDVVRDLLLYGADPSARQHPAGWDGAVASGGSAASKESGTAKICQGAAVKSEAVVGRESGADARSAASSATSASFPTAGWTALMWACSGGHEEAIEALIKAGEGGEEEEEGFAADLCVGARDESGRCASVLLAQAVEGVSKDAAWAGVHGAGAHARGRVVRSTGSEVRGAGAGSAGDAAKAGRLRELLVRLQRLEVLQGSGASHAVVRGTPAVGH